jgi:hypothetical protein
MPILSGPVNSYVVSVESSAGGHASYRIRLNIDVPSGPDQILDVVFVDSPPDDFILFATGFVEVGMPVSAFASTYEIVRTERPVFAAAQETQLFGKLRRRFVLSTDPEPLGEGDADASDTRRPPAPPDPPPNVPLPDPPPFRRP